MEVRRVKSATIHQRRKLGQRSIDNLRGTLALKLANEGRSVKKVDDSKYAPRREVAARRGIACDWFLSRSGPPRFQSV